MWTVEPDFLSFNSNSVTYCVDPKEIISFLRASVASDLIGIRTYTPYFED